jgi:ribosomal protein S18 acetylase RimI-like enzyme
VFSKVHLSLIGTAYVRRAHYLDGLFYASVWDVIVVPPLQRRGISRALLEMAMARTAARGFVVLVATSEGEGLYRAAGFSEAGGGRKALFWRPEQHP